MAHRITIKDKEEACEYVFYRASEQFIAGPNEICGSPSSGWYQIGSHQQISAGPGPCYVYTHPYLHYVHYYFSSWSGSGTGSYSGSNNPASITMNGPITQTANYNYNTNPC